MNTADRVTQLRGRVQGVDRAFDYVVRTCEAWKLAANDASVHERLGRSYATNTFLVIRQALRRELAMGIARLWDSNRRTDNLFSIANTLEDQRVLTALVAEYREYWLRPYDYPLEEFSVEDALAIQKGLVEDAKRLADCKEQELRSDVATCIEKIRQYDSGGCKEKDLDNLKTLRDKRLAHHERSLDNATKAKIDAAAKQIEEIYEDTFDVIKRLHLSVKFVDYDIDHTASLYRRHSSLFWSGVKGERTEGHPSYIGKTK